MLGWVVNQVRTLPDGPGPSTHGRLTLHLHVGLRVRPQIQSVYGGGGEGKCLKVKSAHSSVFSSFLKVHFLFIKTTCTSYVCTERQSTKLTLN